MDGIDNWHIDQQKHVESMLPVALFYYRYKGSPGAPPRLPKGIEGVPSPPNETSQITQRFIALLTFCTSRITPAFLLFKKVLYP